MVLDQRKVDLTQEPHRSFRNRRVCRTLELLESRRSAVGAGERNENRFFCVPAAVVFNPVAICLPKCGLVIPRQGLENCACC